MTGPQHLVAQRSYDSVEKHNSITVRNHIVESVTVDSHAVNILEEDLAVSDSEEGAVVLDLNAAEEEILLASDKETSSKSEKNEQKVVDNPFIRRNSRVGPHSYHIPSTSTSKPRLSSIVVPTANFIEKRLEKKVFRCAKVTKEQKRYSPHSSSKLILTKETQFATPGFKPNLTRSQNEAALKSYSSFQSAKQPINRKFAPTSSSVIAKKAAVTTNPFHRKPQFKEIGVQVDKKPEFKSIGVQTDFIETPLIVQRQVKCETCQRRNSRRNLRKKEVTNQLRDTVAQLKYELQYHKINE